MTTLASDDLLKLAHAERLRQLADPAFARLPKNEQLEIAGRLVALAKPRLAEEYRVEPDALERVGDRDRLAATRVGREEA